MPNPHKLLAEETSRWNVLRAELIKQDDMDERTLLDTLEGETDLIEAIGQIDEFILDAEADIAGVETIIAKMEERKDRAQNRAVKLRDVVARTMEVARLKTVKAPGGTYTLRDIAPAVVVEDEDRIPAKFFIEQKPKLDKKAVVEAVKGGEIVPGTRLSNGSVSLTIRRS